MQCKSAVFVYNGVPCICTALKTNNYVCFTRKHIRNFTFALVAPVGADNCFYH